MKYNGVEQSEIAESALAGCGKHGGLALAINAACDRFFKKRAMSGHSDEWDLFHANLKAARARNARRAK